MAIVTTEEAEKVMKRCQVGTRNHHEANDLHAECYGTIGALVQDRDRLRLALLRAREWGGMGKSWSASIAIDLMQWIEDGMSEELPPLPDWHKTQNAEVQAAAACGGRACNDLLGVTGERAMATETEFTDEDMAAVGRALMQAIKAHADPGWSPADCPSEIVGDMRNERDEARIECDRLSSGIAYAALKLDQATGPAMVRQAYEDLKALVTPNA